MTSTSNIEDALRSAPSLKYLGDWDHWTAGATTGYNALTVSARSVLAHLHGRHGWDASEAYEHCALCETLRRSEAGDAASVTGDPS